MSITIYVGILSIRVSTSLLDLVFGMDVLELSRCCFGAHAKEVPQTPEPGQHYLLRLNHRPLTIIINGDRRLHPCLLLYTVVLLLVAVLRFHRTAR